jgi:hypothetical protein
MLRRTRIFSRNDVKKSSKDKDKIEDGDRLDVKRYYINCQPDQCGWRVQEGWSWVNSE